MNSVAVIGSGISGLSISNLLSKSFDVTVIEKDNKPGGLIKCDIIDGNLYHLVGGHCFNSKREDVRKWFWKFFDRDKEFSKRVRKAVAIIDKPIEYPIENHLYQMEKKVVNKIINELIMLAKSDKHIFSNFEDFLKNKFGLTLYEIYFKPYNEKIWKSKLDKIPLSWLEGKLPSPDINEILSNNIMKTKESKMVHSSFYYPIKNGSQFIANRLVRGLNVNYNYNVKSIKKDKFTNKWVINNELKFDSIIFTANIKSLPSIMENFFNTKIEKKIYKLDSHGTTTVLCEFDKNDYSWIYMPDINYDAHRIICTGNFSKNNNRHGILSGTLEFTNKISVNKIKSQLKKIPFSPKYIAHSYTEFTYPIQDKKTRDIVNSLKEKLEPENFYMLGRFAEWEYYNMDTAIGAAIDLSKKIKIKK